MRNGLKVASLGDKPYKNPEYCGDFKPNVYGLKIVEEHPKNSMSIIKRIQK